jgi:hypothetical protein
VIDGAAAGNGRMRVAVTDEPRGQPSFVGDTSLGSQNLPNGTSGT